MKKIILAEDDLFDAEMTIHTLKRLPLYNPIVHLLNGVAVLDYLYGTGSYEGQQLEEPALLILDIKMPILTGLEVLKAVKSDPNKKHIPVIILTSSSDIKNVVTSFGLGAITYLIKPVDVKLFEDAIGSLGMHWAIVNQEPISQNQGWTTGTC